VSGKPRESAPGLEALFAYRRRVVLTMPTMSARYRYWFYFAPANEAEGLGTS